MPPKINSHAIWEPFSICFQDRLFFFFLNRFLLFTMPSCVQSYRSDFHWYIWCIWGLSPAPGLATLHYPQQACGKNGNLVCSVCLNQFLQEQGERTAAACSKSHKLIVFNLRTFHSPSRRALNGELFLLNSFRPQAFHNCFFFLFIFYPTT